MNHCTCYWKWTDDLEIFFLENITIKTTKEYRKKNPLIIYCRLTCWKTQDKKKSKHNNNKFTHISLFDRTHSQHSHTNLESKLIGQHQSTHLVVSPGGHWLYVLLLVQADDWNRFNLIFVLNYIRFLSSISHDFFVKPLTGSLQTQKPQVPDPCYKKPTCYQW